MLEYDLLTDPESIRANQSGQITKEQYNLAKGKLGSLPGLFFILVMGALLAAAVLLAGKTLAESTPLAIVALVGVIVGTVAITSFFGNLLGGLRMNGASVEQVPGQIVWRGSRYTAAAGGQLLEPVSGNLKLQPGDYTFYRLHGTRVLLSVRSAAAAAGNGAAAPMDRQAAQAVLDQPPDFDPRAEPARAAQRLVQIQQAMQSLSTAEPGGLSQAAQADLMRRMAAQVAPLVQGQNLINLARETQETLHESELASRPPLDRDGLTQLTNALEQTGVRRANALSTNLAGRQSQQQRFGLARDVVSNLTWAALFGAGWLALDYVFATRHEWTSILAVTLFFLIVLAVTLAGTRKELSDFLAGRVQVEDAQVTKFTRHYTSGRNSRTHFYYQVNQVALEVSQYAYNALIEGNYRVCYLPNSHHLVNIDPLPAGAA